MSCPQIQAMLESIKSQKVFALVDCNCFFVSCEVLRKPYLAKQRVCVWKDIVVAASYEAKSCWIKVWTPVWEARKMLGPGGVFLNPDLDFYGKVSSHLMKFLMTMSVSIEIFSIDEAFIEITGIPETLWMSVQAFWEYLKNRIRKEIWIPVSIWISSTRILSKMFAEVNKPFWTCTAIKDSEIDELLRKMKVSDIPFIGKESEKKIMFYAPMAIDFKYLSLDIIKKTLKWPGIKLYFELNWINAMSFEDKHHAFSISRTYSFNPNFTWDKQVLLSHLIHNFEKAFFILVDEKMELKKISVLLRYKDFRCKYWEYTYSDHVSNKNDIMTTLMMVFDQIYDKDAIYRSTWVIFSSLRKQDLEQMSILSYKPRESNLSKVVNAINLKHWCQTLTSCRNIWNVRKKRWIWNLGAYIWTSS